MEELLRSIVQTNRQVSSILILWSKELTYRVKTSYDPGDNASQAPTTANRPDKPVDPASATTSTAGPAALPTPPPSTPSASTTKEQEQIRFHFAPTMGPMLNPPVDQVPKGTDAWAFAQGYTSVTPIRAEYAGLHSAGRPFASDAPTDKWPGRIWD